VGTYTLLDSRHTMARSYPPGHPNYKPPNPAKEAAKAKADADKADEIAKEKHDKAVTWYVDVLGFPNAAAEALYTEQTLTDTEVLSKLTDKQIDTIYEAVRKRGGAGSKGDPIPILAVERLKLAVFCLKLAI
jgi:predicted ribosome quality control (RQC) complex YloA/Tae2 family protein